MQDTLLSRSSFFDQKLLTPSLLFEGLWDAPKALLLAHLLKTRNKPILVITSGEREQSLYQDLTYFAPGLVHEFPAWETLPGEQIAPSPDIVGKRLSLLHTLLNTDAPMIILTPLQGILQKVLPVSALKNEFIPLKVGQEVPFDFLPDMLLDLGYTRETVVCDKGQFAIRGGIIDVFPPASKNPYRIDFFGDTVHEIRAFDPIGQTSVEKVDEILIVPAQEFERLVEGNLSTLFDYFKKEPLLVFDELLAIEDQYVTLKSLPGAISPFFEDFDSFFKASEKYDRLYFSKEPVKALHEKASTAKDETTFEIFNTPITTCVKSHPFIPIPEHYFSKETQTAKERFKAIADTGGDDHLLFLTDTESEKRLLDEMVKEHMLPHKTEFATGYLSSGFFLTDIRFACIPYTELTKRLKVKRDHYRNTYHTPASEFHHLEVGDSVVHYHNGIGKYLGIEKQKDHLGAMQEFFVLEYAKKSKLYVPLSQSHLISRYIGTREETPPLHTLGTKVWQRAKLKAQTEIVGYAKDLLHNQATRELHGGYTYEADGEDVLLFEEEFPFVETADQQSAIKAIKQDMQSAKAMDRLICGDVGYGKTEVAMRAAFKAVLDGGKQVAVLVPTTVLAMQHYESFKERMGNFPVTVGVLSRFVSNDEIKKTIQGARDGSIDIVIGTHRLVSKDIVFKDLGMIIIDEEQRFGVRAKEHLKKLKDGVDCLTLSATPIPRTLYMSLVGSKDISVINSPPHDRLPIKSVISERDHGVIKNALLRELAHDGQAYVIHNRVETIGKVAEEIKTLVPKATVEIVHGQMPPGQIDKIFHGFKRGDIDILCATTIIESGIDIPNANTILIDRAHHYGMADLYQLRGRVGRWNRPSYAYFLVPQNRELPEISQKRLQALIESSGFGGGMKLAMRDLEIRGAGDILGVKQSGNVSSVGFHLYCKLLKKAVKALKEKKTLSFVEAKVEIPVPASIPSDYLPETELRMEIYHRLGEAITFEDVEQIMAELKDRFGTPPLPVMWLYTLTRLSIKAREHNIISIKWAKNLLKMEKQTEKEVLKESILFPFPQSPNQLEEHIFRFIK